MRACEQHGLNLLEVPRADARSWRSAGRPPQLIEQRDEEARRRLALETQRQLTAAAGRDDARSAIVQRLAKVTGGAAWLVAPDGRPLGEVPRSPVDTTTVDAELDRIRVHGLRGAATSSDAHHAFFLLPVGLTGRPAHYLAAAVEGRASDGQRSAVTTAVALLSLVADQERQRTDTRRDLTTRVLRVLFTGDAATARVVAEAAGLPRLPARLRVVRAAGSAGALDDVLDLLEQRSVVAGLVEEELCALVSSPRALEVLADSGLRVGVGERVALDDVVAGHRTAGQALARSSPAAPVVRWEDVMREGVAGLIDPAAAATFSTSFLGGLDDELVETLAAFLRHHGSRLQVAADLGVHRNTARNRVEQIEAVLGRSLDDPATRVSAWLALQARQGSGA